MTETIFRCHQGVEDGSNLILTIIYYTKCLPSLRNVFAIPVTNKIVSYQPIENYGIIGDLNTIALVGLNGSSTLCVFRDSILPVYCALLDDKKAGVSPLVLSLNK